MTPRSRPSLVLLGVAALLGGNAFASRPAAGQETAGAPEAVLVDPIHDAGTVGRGKEVRHDFTIRNEGTAPLHIREVKPTCGCTVAEYDQEIAPGGQGRVTAVVDTSSFRGPIAKPVIVFTDDPKNPSLRLTIRAHVLPFVDVVPGWVRYQHVRGAPSQRVTQNLWATGGRSLEILGVESSLDAVATEFRRATRQELHPDGPDEQWLVEMTLASDAPIGPVVGSVVVRTDHPESSEVEIPVAGYVKPVVSVAPDAIRLGTFDRDETRRASLVVTDNGDEPIAIVGAESELEGLTAEVEERREGQYQILLTLAPGLPSGPVNSLLEIRFEDEGREPMTVPISGTVR